MINREHIEGHLAIISANIIFGLNIPVTKSLITGWMTPMGYTLTRMLFGTAAFWLIGCFTKKEKVAAKDMIIIALAGLSGLVLTQFGFALSLRFTTPVIYALISALSPIAVLVLSALFLKEMITGYKIFGAALAVSGAFIVILGAASGVYANGSLIGVCIAAAAISIYSVYLIIIKSISEKYSPVTLMKWMFLFALIILLPFGLGDPADQKIYSADTTFIAVSELLFALIFSSLVAFFLIPVGLKRIKASTASIYINLQPVTASVAAIFAGLDIFSWDKAAAAALVMTGVYFVTIKKEV